jgi:penicillin-insensitive murein endopeptidase
VKAALCIACTVGLLSCAEIGVVSDGSSLSYGTANAGKLLDGAALPTRGPGFVVYATWQARGLRYGTDELITLLMEVGDQMRAFGGPPLAIGDLAFRDGGSAAPHHRSHQSGRDADLLLYLVDAAGKPKVSNAMLILDDEGRVVDGSGERLDVAREWALVKSLMVARSAEVQHIFLSEPLIQLVLDYARAKAERPSVIERARELMSQPAPNAPHNDHMHIRVYCSDEDAMRGCVDFGAEHRRKPLP